MANGLYSVHPTSSLSIARIHRLLRPLRNRCSALATLDKSRSFICITYSNAKSLVFSEAPPLDIIPNPGKCISRAQIEKLSGETLELARRIYAVVAAFKEVLEKADTAKGALHRDGKTGPESVPSLRRMCSVIIGEHIEPDLEPDSTKFEEEEAVGVVEHLYEQIPPTYRGWTLISHVLQIILDTCPHHPTLLRALIDITLENGLLYHSRILVKALLVVALSTSIPSSTPPICHPAHSNFLIELLVLWERKGLAIPAFLEIFCEAMDLMPSVDAWSCKATTKLLYYDCRRNPLLITPVVCDMIRFISLHDTSKQCSRSNVSSQGTRAATLQRTLRVWLECVLNSLISSPPSAVPNFDSVWTLLEICKDNNIHLCPSSKYPDGLDQNASSVVVCITTLLLSKSLSHSSAVFLFDLLHEVEPLPSIYEPLISQTIAITAGVTIAACKEYIQCYGSTLRSRGLFHLEAALWGSSLREIEKSDCLFGGCDRDALRAYRTTLIECVENAEQRCFGSYSDCKTGISSSPTKRSRDWEWEPIVGCWIRKKLDTASTCASFAMPVSSSTSSASVSVGGTGGPPQKKPRLSRRPSSFASLLSDALSNRSILHEGADSSSSFEEYEHEEGTLREWKEPQASRRFGTTDGAEGDDLRTYDVCHPSSEDGLDLFAYNTSPWRP